MKKAILIITGFAACLLTQAQSLTVKNKNGSKQTVALGDIRKLTFTGGAMNIVQKNLTTGTVALSDIAKITFGDDPLQEEETEQSEPVIIYPNPVRNQATVEIAIEGQTPAIVSVLDIQGRELVKTEATGKTILQLGNLQTGVYLCKVCRGNETTVRMFVKQ